MYAKNDKLDPCIINQSILTRSSAQVYGGPKLPLLAKTKKSSIVKELVNLCWCLNVVVIKSIKKEKVERWKFAWETNHKMDYLLRRVEGSSEPFMPLQGPEPEVSDDFAQGLICSDDEVRA